MDEDDPPLAFPKPGKRKKKPRKKTPKRERREAQRRVYLEETRPAYLRALARSQRRSTPLCEACGERLALEVHHRKGREGDLLIDPRFYLGVCRTCHDWIGNNPALAYRLGYSVKRNQ